MIWVLPPSPGVPPGPVSGFITGAWCPGCSSSSEPASRWGGVGVKGMCNTSFLLMAISLRSGINMRVVCPEGTWRQDARPHDRLGIMEAMVPE